MASNLPAYAFQSPAKPLPTKGGYTLLPTSLANQGAQLIPTSIAQGGAQLLDPNSAANMASTQFDQAIADAKNALAQQQSTNDQSLANVGNWYDQVLGAQAQATSREAALQAATEGSEKGANAAVLASLGGGANSAGSSVAAAGQNNLGTLQALGAIQGDYNADITPLLQAAKAGASSSQQNFNTQMLAQAGQNVNDLVAQKGQAQAQYLSDIMDKNNAIRDTQQSRLLDILTANNGIRDNRAKTLADIVGANNQTLSQAHQDHLAQQNYALNVRQANSTDTQNKIAAILATGYDPQTGSLTKPAQVALSQLIGVAPGTITGTDAGRAGEIVTAGINASKPILKTVTGVGLVQVDPATGKTTTVVPAGAKSTTPRIIKSGNGYWSVDPNDPAHPTKIPGVTVSTSGEKTATPTDISNQIYEWRHGKTEDVHNGDGSLTTEHVGALTYPQAYQAARTIYHMSDKQARAALDTQYGRGEQGRAWLTNEEQATLRKAGRQTYVGKYQGHPFITPKMADALRAAGQLPPGELVSGRYFIKPTTHVAASVAGQ